VNAAKAKAEDKPEEQPEGQPAPARIEDVAKPFHDASMKFLQSIIAAQQTSMNESLQAYLDFQQAVRRAEQEAYDAVVEATRKHMNRMSEQAGTPEEMFSSRMQSQINYESELRQIYANAQSQVQELAQNSFGPNSGEVVKRFAALRQDAYQQYLTDLQRAWSDTTSLDPQAIKAIASNILCTLSVY
jgi:hypothetical protein